MSYVTRGGVFALDLGASCTSFAHRSMMVCVTMLFFLVGSTHLQAQAPKPNIIHIFADDMGKGSVGVHGQLLREANSLPFIKTPNIDALAYGGLTFNRAYAATLCSPSRGMLYFGFNQAHNANDRNTVNPRAQDVSLAEVVKQANYNTSVFGKWGFGGSGGTQTSSNKTNDLRINPSVTDLDAIPTAHGYDEFTGYINHSRAHRFYTSSLWTTDPTGNPVTGGLSETMLGNVGPSNSNLRATYTHDVLAAESEQYIEDHYQDADPFFMQVNYTIPHNDLEAIQHVPNWFDSYNDVDTSTWTDKEKFYAAMITRMDSSIGSLVDKLKDPNGDGDFSDSILDDTLIVFTSDNGATDADFNSAGLNHFGLMDDYRGGKRDLWEGGINMPQFMRWDGVIREGTTTDHLTDLTDFMATIADLAGVQAPVGIDGHSLAPLITGTGIQRERDYLVFEHHEGDGPDPNGLNPRWAIIRGDYKLIEFSTGEQRLYNLVTDPDENNQLDKNVPANAALVTELTSLALAEGVEQPASYDHQYGAWIGGDGNSLNDGSRWDLGTSPSETWSTTVNNTSGSASVVIMSGSIDTLGFEVQGDSGQQTVLVDRGLKLTGRNAVRIDSGGRVHLDDATLESWRWTDVLAGGELSGHGVVESDVYNFGTIAPGRPSGLPAPSSPPSGVNTGLVTAIDFDFVGQDVSPMTNTSVQNQYLQLVQGFSFGPGTQPRHAGGGTSDVGNEFNVTGFASGTVQNAIDNGDYLTFSIAPIPGIEMSIDTIAVNLWRNGSGAAQSFGIFTSLDGFTSNDALATATYTDTGIGNQHLFSAQYSGGQSTTDTVEIRIYGWAQSGGSGNTHFNDAFVTANFMSVASSEVSLDPTGILDLTGDLYHVTGATISMQLGGTDNSDLLNPQFDALRISGDFRVEGMLHVAFSDSFIPTLGDTFDILDFGTALGAFESISLPALANGLVWDTSNLLVTGELQVIADVDFDADGDVDGADFLELQRMNPSLISEWQAQYRNGTSPSSLFSQVPEPSSLTLLLVSSILLSQAVRSPR